MTIWSIIVIVLCMLLLAFMFWKEWQRVPKSRRLLWLSASLLAIVSFAFFTMPLTRDVNVVSNEKPAIILTEGFDPDSVRNFLRQSGTIPVYIINNQLHATARDYNAQFVSVAEWPRLRQQFSDIHIFGYGLEDGELQPFLPSSLVFHPSRVPDGIASVHWQPKLKSGDLLEVQGSYFNSSSAVITLVLTAFDKNLDTAFIPAKKHGYFKLFATPKQLGRAIYSLVALSGKDTVQAAPVPFEVAPPDRLKVLMLSASPDFETKFLKSWLSQNNYAVVSRTAISRNKYEKEFLNTPQVAFNTISGSFLNSFNILIADTRALAAITKPELAAIETQVSQKGLGLIIKGDTVIKSSFYARLFPVVQTSGSSQKSVQLSLPGINYAATLPMAFPGRIRQQPGTQTLIQDNGSNILVSNRIYGAGKLVYTTLSNTYIWRLSGAKNEYQRYWSYLLSKATAQTAVDHAWSVTPDIPFVNQPVQLTYTSNNDKIPQVQIGGASISFIQNPDLPFQWQSTYWPQRVGWQPAVAENRNLFWWYAYSQADWKTVSALQTVNATAQYISSQSNVGSADSQRRLQRVPVNKTCFFILFLVCVGFLWAEKKLGN